MSKASKADAPLSKKQLRFVKEYLRDFNGTQAAIRAGYSAKTANVQSSQLLTKPNIASAIQSANEKVNTKLDLSVEWVLTELKKVAGSNLEDYMVKTEDGLVAFDFSKVSRDQFAAISEITVDQVKAEDAEGERAKAKPTVNRVKVKTHSKLDALEKIGKHLGMWKGDTGKVLIPVHIGEVEESVC